MCYFGSLFTMTDAVVDTIDHNLKHPKLGKVDLVVGIGLSGTMPLIPVKQKSGINVCAMRKPRTKSHGSNYAMMSWRDRQRYVILDDFIESGETIKGLRVRLGQLHPGWVCAGVLLYHEHSHKDSLFKIRQDIPVLTLADEIGELHELRKEKDQA